jgi:hypothetical protein
LAEILLEGRESLEAYRESELMLQNTRARSPEKRDHEDPCKKREADRRTSPPGGSPGVHSAHKLAESANGDPAAQAPGSRESPHPRAKAATGFEVGRRAYELGIARDDIVARAVEPISKKAYRKLYREAAKRYGFGEDWYVLAAVAKVESGHGTSLGPSTAGR